MSRGKVVRAPGHEVGRDHVMADQAFDERGRPIEGNAGHAKCLCREISPAELKNRAARRRWLRIHREEMAGVPWSDAGMAKRYR